MNFSKTISSLPQDLKLLITNSFFVAFASFMITPFLPVLLEHSMGLNLSLVGTLVAASTLVQFGGGIFGAWIASNLGLRTTMLISLWTRVFGFILLIAAIKKSLLVVPALILLAASPALYLPANRAYVVLSVTTDLKPLFLSISNAALNAGMAFGPLVAAYLISDHPSAILIAAALIYLVLAISHHCSLSNRPDQLQKANPNFFASLPGAFEKSLRPAIVSLITYYCYFFFQNFMALYVAKMSSMQVFSYCSLLNFSLLFLLQPLFAKKIAQVSYRSLQCFGFGLMSIGFLTFSLGTVASLFVGTFIMTLGELALFLRNDLEIVNCLQDAPTTAFAIVRLTTGLGGFLSGIVGGRLLEQCIQTGNPEKFWLLIAIQCALTGALAISMTNKPAQKLVAA